MANEEIKTLLSMLHKQAELLNAQIKMATERLTMLEQEKPVKGKKQPVVSEPVEEPVTDAPKPRKGIGGRKPVFTKCQIPGCKEPHVAQGCCGKHYAQFRRAKARSEE